LEHASVECSERLGVERCIASSGTYTSTNTVPEIALLIIIEAGTTAGCSSTTLEVTSCSSSSSIFVREVVPLVSWLG